MVLKTFLLSAIIFLVIIPFVMTSYYVHLFFLFFLYGTLASVWNLHAGFGNMISFGNIALYGIAAYVVGILLNLGVTVLFAVLTAGIISSILGIIVFYSALRLRGPFFIMVTLAFFQVARELANALVPVTGGPLGMVLPRRSPLWISDYFTAMLLMLATIILTYKLRYSRLGLNLIAIREDEDAAEMLGVNTTLVKLQVWTIAAFIIGICGGVYAYTMPYIDPNIAFPYSLNFAVVYMVTIGGSATILGPILGGALLIFLSELVRTTFWRMQQAIFGLFLIFVVLFLRNGIVNVVSPYVSKLLSSLPRRKGQYDAFSVRESQ